MMTLLNRLSKARYVLASSVCGVVGLLLPVDSFEEVTQEMIALLGLLMAGILPTMVLTASALRAGNLSPKKLLQYRDALSRQMKVWIGLFIISLIACVLVIIGKMLGWSLPLALPKLGNHDLSEFNFDAIRIVNGAIAALGSLLVFRAWVLGNGIISLLALTSELAIGEAQLRNEERSRSVEAEILQMPERPGYGDYVELKH